MNTCTSLCLNVVQEQDAIITEMRSGLGQHEIRQQRASTDTYRLSDDDESENTDTLDRAVARNIDIDSAMIDEELSGISEPLSVSFLYIAYS